MLHLFFEKSPLSFWIFMAPQKGQERRITQTIHFPPTTLSLQSQLWNKTGLFILLFPPLLFYCSGSNPSAFYLLSYLMIRLVSKSYNQRFVRIIWVKTALWAVCSYREHRGKYTQSHNQNRPHNRSFITITALLFGERRLCLRGS